MRTIWSFKNLLIAVLLMLACNGMAQSRFQTGFLGSMNLNHSLSKELEANVKWEHRVIGYRGVQGADPERNVFYDLSDASLLVLKKAGVSAKWGGGYLWRMGSDGNMHRLIQQFIWVQRYHAFRLGWRLSTDQSFASGEAAVYRLRLRAVAEIPLNGQVADPGEWYLKLGSEYLSAWSGNRHQPEIRFVPLMGYEFSDRNKLELGMDYRLRNPHLNTHASQYWFNVNWFYKWKGLVSVDFSK